MKKYDWFDKLLTVSGTTLPIIRNNVNHVKNDYKTKHKEKSRIEIADMVSRELISKAAVKTGGTGGITSAPATIPGFGTVGTLLIGITSDMYFLLKEQIELCYSLSIAYDVNLDEEELKAITLALIGFSGSTQAVKGATAGVMKASVDKMASGYLKKGLSKASMEVVERLIPRLFVRFSRLIPLISIPIGASLNFGSTVIVGRRARDYFREAGTNN